ncbi:MAG: glutathione peroxidase [Calditrichia bacterium]
MQHSIYDFEVNSIDGEPVSLKEYKNKVLLIVNVASKCGFTPQYTGLQNLYETYHDKGLEILGFPANDFLWQEPGSDDQIKEFCSLEYGVSFPMFSKISVKGKSQHPLYSYLTDDSSHPGFGGNVKWNFAKFLVGRDGSVCGRFGSRTEPSSSKLIRAIEAAL